MAAMDEKMARRVAQTYTEVYQQHGYKAAADYAERLLSCDPELQEQVKAHLRKLHTKKR